MMQLIKDFIKDLTSFNMGDNPEDNVPTSEVALIVPDDEMLQDSSKGVIEQESPVAEAPKPKVISCEMCGKDFTWKEDSDLIKSEISDMVSEMQLMGCECCIDLLCHQCASVVSKNRKLSLQPFHFCFCWGNKDWNEELREIARYYGEEFAQKSRANQEDLRHKVIVDDPDEYRVMLQVLRRMNFRYPRKDISGLLTEVEKRTYLLFTGKSLSR